MALVYDPYTRACAKVIPIFREFVMAKAWRYDTVPGFPAAIRRFYPYKARDLESSLGDYSAYVRLIPEVVENLRTDPTYGEDIEALAQLKLSADALLSELKFHYEGMNWRKVFVQRHFMALLRDLDTIFTTAKQLPPRTIRSLVESLSHTRDEIFQASTAERIEEYLELAAEFRSQESYLLRRIQLEREEGVTIAPLNTLEELENDLLVRVLFEDATGSQDCSLTALRGDCFKSTRLSSSP